MAYSGLSIMLKSSSDNLTAAAFTNLVDFFPILTKYMKKITKGYTTFNDAITIQKPPSSNLEYKRSCFSIEYAPIFHKAPLLVVTRDIPYLVELDTVLEQKV